MKYSGTPPYRHPGKAAIYGIADTSFGPKCVYIICLCTIKTPEVRDSSYSIKRTGSPASTMPELYEIHLIIWMVVYRFCLPLSVDSKARHYISTVTHHVNLFNRVRQWKGP